MQRETVIKATVLDSPVEQQTSREPVELLQAFTDAGAIEPPYDPLRLCKAFENSNCLRPNTDAYATNVDGFGYRLEAVIDFDAPDARVKVAQALDLERAVDAGPDQIPDPPSDTEVEQALASWSRLARIEHARAKAFFEHASFDESFSELRKKTRQDLEVTGNAYWEVLRNSRGEIARFVYVPSFTCRLMMTDPEPIEFTERVRVAPVTLKQVSFMRRMRRFVQILPGTLVQTFFRSFGDPRFVGARTGKVYANQEALDAAGEQLAREMIHFKIPAPDTAYGIPRWAGVLMSVMGSRSAEEINYLYFDNKSVPPLALLVSGGSLSESSVPRIENFIKENLRGKANFHKILILEAEGSGTSGTSGPKIELRPLTDAQQGDALFQKYDERNIDKVGSAFRLPPLLRGDGRDFNRSVADAQLRFAEDQVFQPLRDEFDFFVNRRLMSELGIRFWSFKTATVTTRDPERMTDQVEKLTKVGVLTPGEARTLAGDIFNRDLERIDADWTKRPITLTLAGIQNGVQDLQTGARPETVVDSAKRLLTLRDELEADEAKRHEARLAEARRLLAEGPETETIKVPRAEFASWLQEQTP